MPWTIAPAFVGLLSDMRGSTRPRRYIETDTRPELKGTQGAGLSFLFLVPPLNYKETPYKKATHCAGIVLGLKSYKATNGPRVLF